MVLAFFFLLLCLYFEQGTPLKAKDTQRIWLSYAAKEFFQKIFNFFISPSDLT